MNEKRAISQPGGGRLSFIAWVQFVGVILVVFGHFMNGIEMPHF